MYIKRLSFAGFRNLQTGQLCPSPGINILYGDNAQGKTNLLEACWLFTGGKSFRGAKERDCVQFSADAAVLQMDFEAENRQQTAKITIGGKKKLILNDIPQSSPTAITGKFCAVVFCPSHLQLLSGLPQERRKFIDGAYCQLRPGYIAVINHYHHVLTQRNSLLKTLRAENRGGAEMLAVWNEQLAAAAAKVTVARLAYLQHITPLATEIYRGLSGGREDFSVTLQTPITDAAQKTPSDIYRQYLLLLQDAQKNDLAAGFSTVGAHREDVCIHINGISAKNFGSQGQQRSAVLALKLAEASLLRQITGEQPIALLDDVMSELDLTRQDYILNHIHDWQVLITCCDPVAIERQTGGKVFHIQQGKIL